MNPKTANRDHVQGPSLPMPPAELISTLERAAFMARRFQAAGDQSEILQIYSSLTQAHLHLSSFLSSTPPPILSATENFLSSSAAGLADGEGEPMQTGEEDSEENGAEGVCGVEKVAERMRDCFIKNKRRKKRPLSPQAAAARVELEERRVFELDGDKSRALELVYQFHG